jgi:hypothetical protein
MARPAKYPEWASDGVNVVEPSEGKKDTGWLDGERPPIQWINWLFKFIHDWIKSIIEDDIDGAIPKRFEVLETTIDTSFSTILPVEQNFTVNLKSSDGSSTPTSFTLHSYRFSGMVFWHWNEVLITLAAGSHTLYIENTEDWPIWVRDAIDTTSPEFARYRIVIVKNSVTMNGNIQSLDSYDYTVDGGKMTIQGADFTGVCGLNAGGFWHRLRMS